MRGSRRLADQSGFTLPELLVALMISLMVVAGAGTVLMIAVKAQPRTSDRSAQIQQGRVMLERITRELRQGENVADATASGLRILTYVHTSACGSGNPGDARLCSVTYSCAGSSCTRTESDSSGGGPELSRTVAEGLLNADIFSYAGTPPTWVGVTLAFPSQEGEETVTLADGVYLRNYQDSPQS